MALPADIKSWREWLAVPAPEGPRLPWTFLRPDGEPADVALDPRGITVIAARPSMGKTLLMTSLAAYIADAMPGGLTIDPPVIYATNDEAARRVAARVAAASEVLGGEGIPDDSVRVLPVDGTVEDCEIAIRGALMRHGGAAAVMWDFLQYLQTAAAPPGAGERGDVRVRAIMEVIRRVAMVMACPQVVAAQVNREPLATGARRRAQGETVHGIRDLSMVLSPRRPDLHHIMDGGSEQSADCVITLQCLGGDIEVVRDRCSRDTVYDSARFFVATVRKDRFSHERDAVAVLERSGGLLVDAPMHYHMYSRNAAPVYDDDGNQLL